MSSMYRLPNGRIDFATIMKLYMEELQKDDSEILRECEARGRQATEANREFNQHRAGTAGRPMSSFGHIHKTAAASVSKQHKVSKLVGDLEAQSQVASNAGSSNDASQTLELALNSMTRLQFIVQNGGGIAKPTSGYPKYGTRIGNEGNRRTKENRRGSSYSCDFIAAGICIVAPVLVAMCWCASDSSQLCVLVCEAADVGCNRITCSHHSLEQEDERHYELAVEGISP